MADAWGGAWARAWGSSWGRREQDWNAWGQAWSASWGVAWGPISSPAPTRTVVHPSSGIKKLTPAMLKKMQRRDAARTEAERLRREEEELAMWLLE